MKKIILLLLLTIVSVSCKDSMSNEFVINRPSVILSKQTNGYNYKLKYKYIVEHYSQRHNFYSKIDIYTNQNFRVGDTLKLTTK